MGRRKSCSLLPSFPPFSFSLALFLISLFFLYFSFLSRLSSRSWCMCVHPACSCMRREVSFAGPRYIYEEPPASNGFDVLGRNAYLSRARSACTHTRAWGDSSCVRARARWCAHACTSRSRDARYGGVGKTRKDSRTHTPARAARA